MDASTPLHLGFLTVLNEQSAYLGGYLVTNIWGRPLEFRLTSAVQPNRVQQILYGPTLPNYVSGDLIGKTLIDKTGLPIQLVVTDTEAVLDLRIKLDIPVVWVLTEDRAEASGVEVRPRDGRKPALRGHTRFPEDIETIRLMIARAEDAIDLNEPFARIREAIGEARRTRAA